jgi:putative transcriptional regulator
MISTNPEKLIRKKSVSIGGLITLFLLASLPNSSRIEAGISDPQARPLPFRRPVSLPPIRCSQPEGGLAKGHFLVAGRQLRDPNFAKSVVLLIDYDQDGAMGVVINRPTNVRLSSVFPEFDELRERPDTVFVGGPVAKNQVLLLIRSGSPIEESHHVVEDMYVSASRKVFQHVFDRMGPIERFRVYAGYAGWGPGQLDREVSNGDWLVLQADTLTVFDKEPSEVWPDLIGRTPELWAKPQAPDQIVSEDFGCSIPSRVGDASWSYSSLSFP